MALVLARLARLRRSSVFELAFIVVVALSLALAVQAYAVKPYRIPSRSMEPTLTVGDRVLVNRAAHRLGAEPHVGDIVVFHPPAGADAQPAACGSESTGEGTEWPCDRPTAARSHETFIKRVVAVGGDTVALRDGHVIRNGRPPAEPFAAPCRAGGDCDYPHAITCRAAPCTCSATTAADRSTAATGSGARGVGDRRGRRGLLAAAPRRRAVAIAPG